MAKFKRKPEIADAMQWQGHIPEMEDFTGWDLEYTPDKKGLCSPDKLFRPMIRGDWLVRENHEYVVLSNAVFQERYEAVPDVVVPWVQTDESSNLAGYSYDGPNERLVIEFRSGGRYQYEGVSLKTFEGLRESKSKGSYFYSHIKDSHKWAKLQAK